MTATNVSIANRALQKCGVGASGRITALTDNSKNAAAVNNCFAALRESELQSNFWGFAIKRQMLRAVATTDKLITPATYSAVTTYALNDIVIDSGIYYISLQAANLANTPATATAFWAVYWGPLIASSWATGLIYYRDELVYVGSNLFLALTNTTAGVSPAEGTQWHQVNTATLTATPYRAPVNGRTYTYVLPRDFLRLAPTEPKVSLETPDWLIENGAIVTDLPGPITLRYVRKEDDASKFNALFAEALAAKIGLEVCEELTQSTGKIATLDRMYTLAIYRARITNAIENGPIEVDEDPWLIARL